MEKQVKEAFDVNQGHGNHNDAIFGDDSEWMSNIIPECIQKGAVAWGAKSVANRLGGDYPPEIPIAAINYPKGDIVLSMLLGVDEKKRRNVLLSAYPECNGEEVEFLLEEVHEYSAGVEAVLSGTILGGKRDVSFFDTRYALNKRLYKKGETYRFRISAVAYDASVLQDREIIYKDDEAAGLRKKMGLAPETEKDGSVKPLVFDMGRMVATFQSSEAYPDDTEFQSPAYGIAEREAFDIPFYRIRIAIALDEAYGRNHPHSSLRPGRLFPHQTQAQRPDSRAFLDAGTAVRTGGNSNMKVNFHCGYLQCKIKKNCKIRSLTIQ